jgi:hypothetical protein
VQQLTVPLGNWIGPERVGNKRIDKNKQGEQARDSAYLPTIITRRPAISSKALNTIASALSHPPLARAISKTNFRQVDTLAERRSFAPGPHHLLTSDSLLDKAPLRRKIGKLAPGNTSQESQWNTPGIICGKELLF